MFGGTLAELKNNTQVTSNTNSLISLSTMAATNPGDFLIPPFSSCNNYGAISVNNSNYGNFVNSNVNNNVHFTIDDPVSTSFFSSNITGNTNVQQSHSLINHPTDGVSSSSFYPHQTNGLNYAQNGGSYFDEYQQGENGDRSSNNSGNYNNLNNNNNTSNGYFNNNNNLPGFDDPLNNGVSTNNIFYSNDDFFASVPNHLSSYHTLNGHSGTSNRNNSHFPNPFQHQGGSSSHNTTVYYNSNHGPNDLSNLSDMYVHSSRPTPPFYESFGHDFDGYRHRNQPLQQHQQTILNYTHNDDLLVHEDFGRKNRGINDQVMDVWQNNFHEGMKALRFLIKTHKFVAVDTEFPGVISKMEHCRKVEDMRLNAYHHILRNLEELKPIQIGFSFFNYRGQHHPNVVSTIQFNMLWNVEGDKHAPDSIALLRDSGIDFERLKTEGILANVLAEHLITSGLVLNKDITFLCYHSYYDWAYLLQVLTNWEKPPGDVGDYMDLLRLYFPRIYDLKVLQQNWGTFSRGGLQELADSYKIRRVGFQHQAGSDSKLTGDILFAMLKEHGDRLLRSHDKKDPLNVIFGLDHGQNVSLWTPSRHSSQSQTPRKLHQSNLSLDSASTKDNQSEGLHEAESSRDDKDISYAEGTGIDESDFVELAAPERTLEEEQHQADSA